MARSKIPGPEGLRRNYPAIDLGMLARIPSPLPGPIGLGFKAPFLMVPKAVAPSQPGLSVHQNSQISASEWVKKINASDDVPDYFKEQLKSKGNLIYVTNPKKFKVPTNVIEKDWLSDWLTVFTVEQWEMTTGSLDISIQKDDSTGSMVTLVHHLDLSTGESIAGFTQYMMTVRSRDGKALSFQLGTTLPTGATLKSGRKLIAVANRMAVSFGDKVKTFIFKDSELLQVWFHEIACHAGRNTAKKPDGHGDKEVDRYDKDIKEMFPKDTTVSRVFAEIEEFLK